MALCPICASDAVLEDTSLTTVQNEQTQRFCWLECTHCGWQTERLPHDPRVWQTLEDLANSQRE